MAAGSRRREHNRGEHNLKFFDVLFRLTVSTVSSLGGLFTESLGNSKPNVIISPSTAINSK